MGLMTYTVGLAGVNVAVLLYLMIFHIRLVNRMRSSFTVGLLAFTLVFLVQNIVSVYFYLTMMSLYSNGAETPVFFLTAMQTIAFFVYIWVTQR